MQRYAQADLEEIDELADHGFRYRPVRHHFGITSFGVTVWTTRQVGDAILPPYDEDSQPTEELFLVVSGHAVFQLDGDEVHAGPGTLVFVQSGVTRSALATEADTVILAVDGSPGKAYTPTGWELWAPLVPLYDSGEYAELIARLTRAVEANPQYPMLVFNLACAESLSGHAEDAIAHVREAVEADEKFRDDARTDADLDPLREEPAFRALITGQP